jgi:hypothetical protein
LVAAAVVGGGGSGGGGFWLRGGRNRCWQKAALFLFGISTFEWVGARRQRVDSPQREGYLMAATGLPRSANYHNDEHKNTFEKNNSET